MYLLIGIIISLVSAVSENFSHKIGAFILVVLKLPNDTDSEELKSYIKETLKKTYGWEKSMDEVKVPTITKDNFIYYLNPSISSEWTEIFHVAQKSFSLDPAGKNIIVAFKKFGEEKYLYVYVKHQSTQYTGRKEQKEICDKVLDAVSTYYSSKNIDISNELKNFSVITDNLKKYDKELTLGIILLVAFVCIPLTIIILFILIR